MQQVVKVSAWTVVDEEAGVVRGGEVAIERGEEGVVEHGEDIGLRVDMGELLGGELLPVGYL